MSKWWRVLGVNREACIISVRTAVAIVISLLAARSLGLSEFYWAPISTIVIMLSAIHPLTLAWQRFAGTALGALIGALIANYFHPNWVIYGAGIVVCGILSQLLRLGAAYRFAAITMSVVLLVRHDRGPWIVATHRFVEVSLGIAVGLIVSLAWPAPTTTDKSASKEI